MITGLLDHLDTLLLVAFGIGALAGGILMLVLRHPMQVAIALISTMVTLGGIYGLLGVHFIAAFQVLIYVGAVMVFMVYVIMLLDARDPTFTRRLSGRYWPGLAVGLVFMELLVAGVWYGLPSSSNPAGRGGFGLQQFAEAFLNEYWLHFEVTSVLLLAAAVATLAVIKGPRRKNG